MVRGNINELSYAIQSELVPFEVIKSALSALQSAVSQYFRTSVTFLRIMSCKKWWIYILAFKKRRHLSIDDARWPFFRFSRKRFGAASIRVLVKFSIWPEFWNGRSASCEVGSITNGCKLTFDGIVTLVARDVSVVLRRFTLKIHVIQNWDNLRRRLVKKKVILLFTE